MGVPDRRLPVRASIFSKRQLLRTIALAVALVVVVTWLVARLRQAGPLADETWARIHDSGVLRVGMDASYPPFEWVNKADGALRGLDVEMARELAQRWGVDLQIVNVHLDGLYDALKAGKFDLIISALPHDRMLTRDVLYSYTYFNGGQVLMTTREGRAVTNVESLAGKRVAVELGAEAHQLARQLARDRGMPIDIVTLRDPELVARAVVDGVADALICDRVTAHGYLVAHPTLGIIDPPLTDAPYVVAARIDAPVTIGAVNDALVAWRDNGFLSDLEDRWLGMPSP